MAYGPMCDLGAGNGVVAGSDGGCSHVGRLSPACFSFPCVAGKVPKAVILPPTSLVVEGRRDSGGGSRAALRQRWLVLALSRSSSREIHANFARTLT